MVKRCIHVGCTKWPGFGSPGSKLAEYCATHAPENYTDVKNKRCIHVGCTKRPVFGSPGSKLAEYCMTHAPENYTDVKHKRCIHIGCTKNPGFGSPGSKLAEYCATHAPENYTDVKSKRCIHVGCTKWPGFGSPGSKLAEYCMTHAPENYTDVKSKRCIHVGCTKRPVFGSPGSKLAEYCATHAPENYTDVKSKRCIHIGCTKQPAFGSPGSKLAEYCATHAPENYTDIKNKRCIHIGCTKQPVFGKLFGSNIHCAEHKQNNEYPRHMRTPKCVVTIAGKRCDKPAHYGDDHKLPTRCEDHELKTDVNHVNRACGKCHVMDYIRSSQAFCDNCMDETLFKSNQKTKELQVKMLLEENDIVYDSYDKIVDKSCDKKRPDFIIYKEAKGISYVIVLEVDEFQHRKHGYDCSCEHARMINMYSTIGIPTLLIIRYNPDNFTDNTGVRHNTDNRAFRETRLIRTIRNMIPEPNTINISYMFYNGTRVDMNDNYTVDPMTFAVVSN